MNRVVPTSRESVDRQWPIVVLLVIVVLIPSATVLWLTDAAIRNERAAIAQRLVISGQVGMSKAGKLANGVERQTVQAFKNIMACLKANDMTQGDLVKLTVFLTDSRHVEDFRAGRDKVLTGNALPASTLVIVSGLAAPEICVEIEATAARS